MVAECIFCSIIAGLIPADIIIETSTIMVIKDSHPKAPIHYLIMPKAHYRTLLDVDDSAVLGELLQTARLLAKSAHLKDFKLLVNNGYAAGQRVFHVHLHFLAGSNITDLEKII